MVLTESNRALEETVAGKAVIGEEKENFGRSEPSVAPVKTLELVFSTTVKEDAVEEEVEPCTPTGGHARSQLSTARTGRELREGMSKASVGHGVELKSGGKTSAFGEVTQAMSFAQGTFLSVFVPKPKTSEKAEFREAKNPFEPEATTQTRAELTERLSKASAAVDQYKSRLSRKFGTELAEHIVTRPGVKEDMLTDLEAHDAAGQRIEEEMGALLEAHAEQQLARRLEEHEKKRVELLAFTANLDVLDAAAG